jgi:GMP synthase (glutamine-hydrolysing)
LKRAYDISPPKLYQMRPIFVVNNFGQFNHLIHRALRDMDIPAVMVPNTTSPEDMASGCRGIILGGGPTLDRSGNCSRYVGLGLPVLGICLGLHIIATAYGGSVQQGRSGGYGPVDVNICEHNDLLKGYPEKILVWASHADEVATIPRDFSILASSHICNTEAIASPAKHIYGLQWHPEVSHTVDGRRIFSNFDEITREHGV